MADYLKSALELLKLAPRYLIAIGVAAAFLLFGSEDFLARLGLKKFTEDYRAWLGLAFVSTVSLFEGEKGVWLRMLMSVISPRQLLLT